MNTTRPTRHRVVMALAFASMFSALSISPVLADNDGKRGKKAHQSQRARYDYDQVRYYRPVYRDPYRYEQPVYVPAPVYYEPRQSPGISLFFPLDLRR